MNKIPCANHRDSHNIGLLCNLLDDVFDPPEEVVPEKSKFDSTPNVLPRPLADPERIFHWKELLIRYWKAKYGLNSVNFIVGTKVSLLEKALEDYSCFEYTRGDAVERLKELHERFKTEFFHSISAKIYNQMSKDLLKGKRTSFEQVNLSEMWYYLTPERVSKVESNK